jgi:hypothetical protein
MSIKESKEAGVAKSPSGRVRRTPVGVRNVLTVQGKDPNYVYRIVNDTGDRVEQFKAGGYETVSASEVQIGDRRVNAATPEGSIAQCSVGGGVKGVVMRIPKEWYEEDQLAKQKQVAETEASTRSDALKADYGKFDIKRD